MKLRNKREAESLIKDIEGLLVLREMDGEPALGLIAHDPVLHEEGDQSDDMQRYCPQCFTINAMKRLKLLIGEAE